MPALEILSIDDRESSSHRWEDVRTYLSPDGLSKAVFYEPFEFHMGAYRWRLKLLREGVHVSSAALEANQVLRGGYLCPGPYRPWSADSARLFLVTWSAGAQLYSPKEGTASRCKLEGSVVCSQASSRFLSYLVVTTKRLYIAGTDGTNLPVPVAAPSQHSYWECAWWDAAAQFFIVANDGAKRESYLRFFDSLTGQPAESIPFHPRDVVPFDMEKYKVVERDRFTLRVDRAHRSAGYLMDEWHDLRFDELTSILKVNLYRPKGETFLLDGIPGCDVEAIQITAQLKP